MKFGAACSIQNWKMIFHALLFRVAFASCTALARCYVPLQWPDCTLSCLRHYPVRQPTCDAVDWDVAAHFCTVIPLSLIPCDYSPYTVIENNHHETLTDFTSLACRIGANSWLWTVIHAASNATYKILKEFCSPTFDRLDSTKVVC